MSRPPNVAVVGGGIAGLAAAWNLRHATPGVTVTVYEQSDTLGGKLRTGTVAGSTVELGAEAFLLRDPGWGDSAAVRMATGVGLGNAVVNPAIGQAALALDGTLVPMPGGTLLGVPADLAKVAAVARPEAERDRDDGRPLLGRDEDLSVGELVRRRLGDEVVDRLVDPLLGGVYAGRADELSLAATMPNLAQLARFEHTLTEAVRAAMAVSPRPPGVPVFGTVTGGMSRLVAAVARASRAEIRLGAPVRELTQVPGGWRVGPDTVDAVVLALPARPAARLLGVEPLLDYASVALVTLALPAPELPALSGFLVPASERTLVKAATFFSNKWAHMRRDDGVALVRASVGRYGEEHRLQVDDAELIRTVHAELSTLVGARLPEPVDARVQRWGGALPQYPVGHVARVAALRATLPPTVALAGAGYDGVGIPACVSSGEAAAHHILKGLSW